MTFAAIQQSIRPCTTFGQLATVWNEAQPVLRTLDKGSRAALTAMKDFYKGMIERNEIEDYQKARQAAARGEFTHDPPPARKAPEKKRRR